VQVYFVQTPYRYTCLEYYNPNTVGLEVAALAGGLCSLGVVIVIVIAVGVTVCQRKRRRSRRLRQVANSENDETELPHRQDHDALQGYSRNISTGGSGRISVMPPSGYDIYSNAKRLNGNSEFRVQSGPYARDMDDNPSVAAPGNYSRDFGAFKSA